MDTHYSAWVNRALVLQDKLHKYAHKCTDCDVYPLLEVKPNWFASFVAVGIVVYCPECNKRMIWEMSYDEERLYCGGDDALLKTIVEKWNEQNE